MKHKPASFLVLLATALCTNPSEAKSSAELARLFESICYSKMPNINSARGAFLSNGFVELPVGEVPDLDEIRSPGEDLFIKLIPDERSFFIGSLVSTYFDGLGTGDACALRAFFTSVAKTHSEIKPMLSEATLTLNEVVGGRHIITYELQTDNGKGILSIIPFTLGETGAAIFLFSPR